MPCLGFTGVHKLKLAHSCCIGCSQGFVECTALDMCGSVSFKG